MSHPHENFLREFRISIDKLVPMTPEEILKEAEELYKQLSEDETVNAQQIHQAMTIIGRKEFPYRKAYEELCSSDEEHRLQVLTLDRLDENLRKKMNEVLKHGVVIDEYVKSGLFEQLEGEERYQIEQAILAAEDIMNSQCDDRAKKRQMEYAKLVEKWRTYEERLQKMIDELRELGERSSKWQTEIGSVADRLEEGWSIVERDPSEEEIKKELEYWFTTIQEDREEGVMEGYEEEVV